MNIFKKFSLLITVLCQIQNVAAQPSNQNKVQGRLLLADGQPASYAFVQLKESGKATTTDAEGKYQFLTDDEGDYTLQISLLGTEPTTQSIHINDGTTQLADIRLNVKTTDLADVVVTGIMGPQSLRNTVDQVRLINKQTIQMRGATNLQTVLNTELGIRFSYDPALGTNDIELMGMTGQNVKVLLNGIPLPDRGSTRESLGQIDVNAVEWIEIIEGPMSVIYGSDALAGVINIITNKNESSEKRTLSVAARVQEETAKNEYNPLSGDGVHNQHLQLNYLTRKWDFDVSTSRNNFGGWQGTNTGRAKEWLPKDQWLWSARMGYRTSGFNIWYQLNTANEKIYNDGNINTNTNIATDKQYTSFRWYHQLQAEIKPSSRFSANLAAAYTDYSRKTQTTQFDFNTGRRTLSLDAGGQDEALFNTIFTRGVGKYTFSDRIIVAGGIEFTQNQSSGDRVAGNPVIKEYAVFLAPEFKIGSKLNFRPGLRFLSNSVYEAPPVNPGINIKYNFSKKADLRLGYARGFRSPALRELYFTFFDSNHAIRGNENLKAEYSHSFNGFFNYHWLQTPALKFTSTLGLFYNNFNDLIALGNDVTDPSISTYINIEKFKTTGFSLNNSLHLKSLQFAFGYQHIGRYNKIKSEEHTEEGPSFNWSPEFNLNITYLIKPIQTSINVAYKFAGKRQAYQLESSDVSDITLITTPDYSMADLSLNKKIGNSLVLNGGIRNLFNVTRLTNAGDTGSGHSEGLLRLSYGRSYFLGLAYNIKTHP